LPLFYEKFFFQVSPFEKGGLRGILRIILKISPNPSLPKRGMQIELSLITILF